MTMKMKLVLILLASATPSVIGFNNDRLTPVVPLAEDDETSLGIYDGTKTTIQKHPYMVSVILGPDFVGGGTIVSESWVVTLAATIDTTPQESIKVCAGCQHPFKGDFHKVKKIVFHPKWRTTLGYNYACLQLKTKLKWSSTVKAISLPSEEPADNTVMTLAGWGYKSNPDVGFGVLRQGTMTWLSKQTCKSTFASLNITWSDTYGCAYNKGKTTVCLGDWGVPYVNDGVFYGMPQADASQGSCSSTASPVLLSDIYVILPWIKKTTGV